jgi:hypothetical protein
MHKIRAMRHKEEIVHKSIVAGELEIDTLGRIWRLCVRRGHRAGGTMLLPCNLRRAESIHSNYSMVKVMWDNVDYYCMAHRLVYYHFFGTIPDGLTINHKDGNKVNNAPANLEAITYSENMKHAFSCLGRKGMGGVTKLTANKVKEIRLRYLKGERQAQLATEYGVCFQNISNICLGKSWKELECVK